MFPFLRKRILQALRLICTFRICIASIKAFRLPNIKGLRFKRRMIAIKYVGTYLARSFDCRCRGYCLINHYRFLNDHLTRECIGLIAESEVILWEEPFINDLLSIAMNFPIYDTEGDLCLRFKINSIPIYYMTFTIIPGSELGISEKNIIFITCVQGLKGKSDLIKKATKALDEVSPAVMLFTAVQAIATSLGMNSVAGITFREQIFLSSMERVDRFYTCYDCLWLKMMGKKINDIAFQMPAIPHSHPLCSVKKTHRCRTKFKRQFKYVVYNNILRTFQQKCMSVPEEWFFDNQQLSRQTRL